jgi:signal transduction histidine kinase
MAEAIAERERDRLNFVATVAHDLRNPLSGISLRAALAEQKARALPEGPEIRAIATAIGDIARSMSGLVDDLLAISTARSGRSMLECLPIAPGRLLARSADAAQPQFAEAGLQLVVEAAPDLPPVHVDMNRILRVFGNLLDNALKFTARGGCVELRAAPASGAVLFTVANSGPALGPEQMERLFLPFWQAGREDRRGAGLGLSICRSIIESHGGSVWGEAADDMRVRICFLLPCTKPVAAGGALAAAPLGIGGLGQRNGSPGPRAGVIERSSRRPPVSPCP